MTLGKFIVLEGLDGSGKTTQARRLAHALSEIGIEALYTKEPTDGQWGRACRQYAQGKIEARKGEVLGWFLNDREEHLDNEIIPALKSGKWVVCDRYEASTWAYQGAAGVDLKDCMNMLQPDVQLFIDTPLYECLRRIEFRGDKERYEKFTFLCDVLEEYNKNQALIRVDGRGTEEEVASRLWEVVRCRFSDI